MPSKSIGGSGTQTEGAELGNALDDGICVDGICVGLSVVGDLDGDPGDTVGPSVVGTSVLGVAVGTAEGIAVGLVEGLVEGDGVTGDSVGALVVVPCIGLELCCIVVERERVTSESDPVPISGKATSTRLSIRTSDRKGRQVHHKCKVLSQTRATSGYLCR